MVILCIWLLVSGFSSMFIMGTFMGRTVRDSGICAITASGIMTVVNFGIYLKTSIDMPLVLCAVLCSALFFMAELTICRNTEKATGIKSFIITAVSGCSAFLMLGYISSVVFVAAEDRTIGLLVSTAVDGIFIGILLLFRKRICISAESLDDLSNMSKGSEGRTVWLISCMMAAVLTAFEGFMAISGTEAEDYRNWVFAAFSVIALICYMIWQNKLTVFSVRNNEALMNTEYMNEMQSFLKTIRSQRHDFNFHVHVLDGLMQRKEYDKCQEYLSTLCADTEAVNSLIPISDMAIAALINNYREMCLKKRIPLEMDIQDDMSGIVCTVYEANKILGNLLQNAYDEASSQTGGKASYGIKLNIFKRGSMTTIRISNRVNDVNKIVGMCEFGQSGKSGHDGIGLNNIMQTVGRWDGVFYWEIKDKDILSFVVKIPNHIK